MALSLNLTPRVDPPPSRVALVEIAQPHDSTLEQMQLDGGVPRRRPKRLTRDVWDLAQEFKTDGGAGNLTEEMAEFSELIMRTRALLDDPDTLPGAQMDLIDRLSRLIDKRVKAKEAHVRTQEKLAQLITLQDFRQTLDEILAVIQFHLKDQPMVLRAIGVGLAPIAQRLLEKQG